MSCPLSDAQAVTSCQPLGVSSGTNRLVTVVLTVANLDESFRPYTEGFGLDLHLDDHQGGEPWTTGHHAATSWTDGAFIHFAFYATKDGATSRGAQVAFTVDDLDVAHQRAVKAGAMVLHAPKLQPWGRSARSSDPDGHFVELTQSKESTAVART